MMSFCQTDTVMSKERIKQIEDSITAELNNIANKVGTDSTIPGTGNYYEERDNNVLEYLVRTQEKERVEKKKRATLEIIVGLLLLVVFIIGMTRKKKKSGE